MTILEILASLRNQTLSEEPDKELIEALSADQSTLLNLHAPHPLLPEDIKNLFKALPRIKTLTHFNLESIARHPWGIIYFRSNQIIEKGVIALAECLKTNTTLTTVNLKNNPIGADGICALALCLTENYTLTELIIGGCFIREEEVQALTKIIRSIDSRFIAPELLVISESCASEDILEELQAAFNDHKEKITQKAKDIEALIVVHFPEPLAMIIASYDMLISSLLKPIEDPMEEKITRKRKNY